MSFKQFLVGYTALNPMTKKYAATKEKFFNKGLSNVRGVGSASPSSEGGGGIRRLNIEYNTDDSQWIDPQLYILKVAASERCKITVLDTIPQASKEIDSSTGDQIEYNHLPTEDIICLGLATKEVEPGRPAIFFLEPKREKAFYADYFEIEKDGDRRIGRQTIKSPVFVNELPAPANVGDK